MIELTKFDRQVTNICADAFERAEKLRDGLQACEGLFPTVAVSHFAEFDRNRTSRWIEEAASEVMSQTLQDIELEASFFLSTWDFSSENIGRIITHAINPNLRTCLLGVPSLLPFLSSALSSQPHVLVDLRVPGTEITDNTICLPEDINSLSGCELSEAFDLCVLDPPWYVENYIKWIDIAGEYCRTGGTIVFPLLGRLTRPSADRDRKLILDYCQTRGLSVRIYKNAVLYDTPSFERNMLWRAGIPPVPWKRADLVIATRDSWKPSLRRFSHPVPLTPFGQSRAFGILVDVVFDRYDSNARDLILIPAGGYWMETPSRRVPSMKSCNVFTSNGAKFISPRPIDLFAVLSTVENSDRSDKLAELERLGFPMDVFGKTSVTQKLAV